MSRSLRILHLEDDAADAELVAATLRADGVACEIVRAASREQYATLIDGSWDLILSDYSIPGFDGATAQRIARERRPAVPFVFVSGTMGEELAIERLNEGATDYVLKQRLSRLSSAVRRALQEAQHRLERDAAEAEVRRLNQELEARVLERTRQLAAAEESARQARLEAERANRAKSEFLSRMSHDLRTPLNAILGFAQVLQMELSGEQADSVRQILHGGRHLLELLNEVLDIARIEAGHLSLSLEGVAVAEVASAIRDLVQPLARSAGVSVDVAPLAEGGAVVRADRQRLAQVLINFVGNAVKYNRRGGQVRVTCERRPNATIRISVTDTGSGIPPEQLGRLFTPFERLSAGETGVEGTGLGLALSKGLVEAMGGSVGVTSTVDVGSTFWVELPEAPPSEAAAASQPEAAPAVRAATGGSVLSIEDNPSNIRLLERLLTRRPGVRLLTASSGEDGIRQALEAQPDLVLLDLHLPDLPGEEVLRRLWADLRTRAIPVAVLTADATTSSHRPRLLAAGAVAYLTKPIDIVQLLRLIDERLGDDR